MKHLTNNPVLQHILSSSDQTPVQHMGSGTTHGLRYNTRPPVQHTASGTTHGLRYNTQAPIKHTSKYHVIDTSDEEISITQSATVRLTSENLVTLNHMQLRTNTTQLDTAQNKHNSIIHSSVQTQLNHTQLSTNTTQS